MKFLKNYTIKTKINLISLGSIIIILLMLMGLFLFTNYLQSNFNNMQNKELHFKDISYKLTTLITRLHKDMLNYSVLNSMDQTTLDSLKEENKIVLNYFNILEELLQNNVSKNRLNTLKILATLRIRYTAYYNLIKTLPNEFKNNYEDGIDCLIGVNDISEKMFEELEIFVILADKRFNKRINKLKDNTTNILYKFIYLSVGSLIIFVLFGLVLKNTIMESLNNLDNGIENFFKFLSQKTQIVNDIQIYYNDELSEIAKHINDNIHDAESLIKNEREFKKLLEQEVNKQTSELKELTEEIILTQKDVVSTMGAIGESRSKETGNHVKRVAEYSRLFAIKYGMDDENIDLLYSASPMHDIGKVAISDNILKKTDQLTEDEFEIMKTHTQLGYEMLKGSSRPILSAAATISLEHHEKWDGTGYPNKKFQDEIHIFGRITAIADVFDALGSHRCYKKAWELNKIIEYIKKERGKYFDPKLVDIFLENIDDFLYIKDKYSEII